MTTPYYEGFVRARRVLDQPPVDHSLSDEVVRRTVRFRVGLSLVTLGSHLMGVDAPADGAPVRSAA